MVKNQGKIKIIQMYRRANSDIAGLTIPELVIYSLVPALVVPNGRSADKDSERILPGHVGIFYMDKSERLYSEVFLNGEFSHADDRIQVLKENLDSEILKRFIQEKVSERSYKGVVPVEGIEKRILTGLKLVPLYVGEHIQTSSSVDFQAILYVLPERNSEELTQLEKSVARPTIPGSPLN